MKLILMRNPRYGIQNFNWCSQAKLSGVGLSCVQMSCLQRQSYENPQTALFVSQTNGYSLQTNSMAPLWRTTFTQLIEHGELELVALTLSSSIISEGNYSTD